MRKRVKEWWFTCDSGKLLLSLRYRGGEGCQYRQGETAVELRSEKELVACLETMKQASETRELVAQAEAVSGAVSEKQKEILC